MNYFTLSDPDNSGNYITSKQLGLYIESAPTVSAPVRNVSSLYVPGRQNPLFRDYGSFGNITRSYNVVANTELRKNLGSEIAIHELLSALHLTDGYCVLYDSWLCEGMETLYSAPIECLYYNARLIGGDNFANELSKFGRGTISFDCKPELRYLKITSESPMEVAFADVGTTEQTATLSKPSVMTGSKIKWFDARPLIKIRFTSAATCTVTVNGYEVICDLTRQTTGSSKEFLYIDSELQTCWYEDSSGNTYNGNPDVTLNTNYSFPLLTETNNTIKAKTSSGEVDNVYVTARWWTI